MAAEVVVGKAKPGHTFSYVIHSHDYARERVAGIMKVGQIDSCTFARFCVYLLLDRGGTRYCAELQHFLLVCLKFPFSLPLLSPRSYFETGIPGISAHREGKVEKQTW